jgi:hypothetical protein
MIIITAVMYSIPYFICLFWFLHLRKQNSKLRTEFFKKLSDSETERDNIFIDFQKAVIENFKIANKNNRGQDENWKSQCKINERQKQTNQEHLEVFQEFDYAIQELDKKVNKALDDQEEILMTKDLDKEQLNIVCRELDKVIIKRDRYENRLTEVCKVVDLLKVITDKNTKLTADNFENINTKFGKVQRNFDKIKDLPSKIGINSLSEKVNNQGLKIEGLTKNLTRIYSELNDRIRDEIRKPHLDTEALAKEVDSLEKKVDEIDKTLNLSLQKIGMNKVKFENIIKVLENPIEVEKPKCETRLKLKKEAEANKVETVTEIVNKVHFEWQGLTFEEGCLFTWKKGGTLETKIRALTRIFKASFAESLWNKLLEANKPKRKRKYTKRNEKKEMV